MNEHNIDQQLEQVRKKSRSLLPVIVTIVVASWIIGVAILGAGWLISREISKQTVSGVGETVSPEIGTPVNVVIPENKPQQGSNDAKVTIIEFADFQCPYCGEWQKTLYPKLKSEYIDTGKVKFVFWDFAFLGEESFKTAEAAMCAKDQNKFWEFHDQLFASQNGENEGTFNDASLKKLAGTLGLDQTSFNQCFDSRIYKTEVEESSSTASSYGVNSTPTVLINGLKFEGIMPWENYKQIIETELAK